MIRWIDITNDASKKYYNAFTQKVSMPEYVKSATVLTEEDSQTLSSNAFADTLNRKFALDSKANCWCSALYFYGNQCNTAPGSKQAEANIINAANVWGITAEISDIKQAFEQQLIPTTYALSFDYRGATVERCPDHTKEAATASAEWLYENRFKFPVVAQKEAAVRLLAKADTLTLRPATNTYLDRLANPDSYANLNYKVATAITNRLGSIPTYKWASIEDELLKLANDLSSKPFEVCRIGSLLVNALEAIDVKHNLNTKWGSSVQHPVDVCCRTNMTKAAAIADTMIHLTTGTPIDLTKISDYQLEKGLKIAGDDFLAYCQTDGLNVDRSKAAEILPTLPRPEAKRFEAGVKSAGYLPESTQALADRIFKGAESAADIHMPEAWEDNAAFDNRMQALKDDANQLNLDAQAAMAASKARQARQAKIVNPNAPDAPTESK